MVELIYEGGGGEEVQGYLVFHINSSLLRQSTQSSHMLPKLRKLLAIKLYPGAAVNSGIVPTDELAIEAILGLKDILRDDEKALLCLVLVDCAEVYFLVVGVQQGGGVDLTHGLVRIVIRTKDEFTIFENRHGGFAEGVCDVSLQISYLAITRKICLAIA